MSRQHLGFWILFFASAWGAYLPAPTKGESEPKRCLVIELFRQADCDQCDALDEFLKQLHQRRPRTRIVVWDIDKNPAGAERLERIGAAFKNPKPKIPSVYLCQRLLTGFENETSARQQIEALFSIQVYWKEGCPRCANGKRFLAELLKKYPFYEVAYREIVKDAKARRDFEVLCRDYNIKAPVVPTFHLAGQVITGFASEATTGKQLEALMVGGLGACEPAQAPTKRQGMMHGVSGALLGLLDLSQPDAPPDSAIPGTTDLPSLPPKPDELSPEAQTTAEGIDVPWLGRLRVREMGLPAFTFVLGLIDGFNPCAMWVLLFLLSILVNMRDRWKILAIAGTFVIVSGAVYLAFMAAWLNVFLLIGYMRPAQVVLGGLAIVVGLINVKDFFAFKWGVSLSIPEAAKPGIYARVRNIVAAKYLWPAVAGAIILAVLVNAVELLCSAGFPAVYTQILAMHELPTWLNYLYLLLYIVAYMFDDSIMLGIVVITLTKTKLQESGGRWLKLLSGIVILLLGIVMILKPDWVV